MIQHRNQALPVAALAILLPAASAQLTQQGNKLVGTGAAGSALQGISVGLSADGNTAIVGSLRDANDAGAAWVFTRSNGVWVQQGSKLVGTGASGAAEQGASVALSADGNTALLGGPNDNNGTGAVWVFTRSSGVWTQQGNKLVGTGAVGPAGQGVSAALSADGNTAVIGGFNDNTQAGAAWVFTRSSGLWTQQGPKLSGTGSVGKAAQGFSVALSADGNTADVGGFNDNNGAGAVWVFTRTGNTWTQQGNKLVGSGAVGNAAQGDSVALSADGNTAIVGGDRDGNGIGAVWVWTRSGNTWTQQGSKLAGTGAVGAAGQGRASALSADGNTAIFGGPNDNNSTGATWVFTRSNGTWAQQGSKLVGTGGVAQSEQGFSVALSPDAVTALLGGPGDNNNTGAAWPFVRLPVPHIATGGIVSGGLSLPSLKILTPNAIGTVFGDTFAPPGTQRGVVSSDLVNGHLPTVLDGVCLFANNVAAPLFFLSDTQINFQLPQVPAGRSVAVQVATSCGTAKELRSATQGAATASASPEFFYFVHNSDGKNPIAALNATTGAYIGPPDLIPGATFEAASPGGLLTLFFTGGGTTNPAFAPGELPATGGDVTGTLSVSVAGTQLSAADILYAGVAPNFAGLYQLNMRVATGTPSGNQPVILTINGAASPAGYLFIGP